MRYAVSIRFGQWQTAASLLFACLLLTACTSQPRHSSDYPGYEQVELPTDWRYDSPPTVDTPPHPADNYEPSILAFEQGRYDDAVFHFYVAELRYRVFLGARPTLPVAFDPAHQASLSHVIGMPVRRYLRDKPARRAAIIDAVLQWHEGNDDPSTPKAEYPSVHALERQRLLLERAEASRHAHSLADSAQSIN